MSTVYLKSEDILLLLPLKSTQRFQHHPAVLSSSLLSGPYRSKLSPFSKPLINRPSPRKSSTTDPAFSALMMGYTESKHIAEHTHAYIRQQLSRHSRLRLQNLPGYTQALCLKAAPWYGTNKAE